MDLTLIKGERYWFYSGINQDLLRNGILTSEYKADGKAVVVDDNDVRWCVDPEKLFKKQ